MDSRQIAAAVRDQAGQAAYEVDCEKRPNYHDGSRRRAWHELSEIARWSWCRPVRVLG